MTANTRHVTRSPPRNPSGSNSTATAEVVPADNSSNPPLAEAESDADRVERRIAELAAVVEKHKREEERRRVLADLERQVRRIAGDNEASSGQTPTRASSTSQSRPRSDSDQAMTSVAKRPRPHKDISAPNPIWYSGESRDRLRAYLRTCEQQFRVKPETYVTDLDRVTMASGYLGGGTGVRFDRIQLRGDDLNMTWEGFKEYLLAELVPAGKQSWDIGRQWNDLRQRYDEPVRQFATRLEQLHDTLNIERSEPERCEKFLFALRPDLFNGLLQMKEAQANDFVALIESAAMVEDLNRSRRYGGDTATKPPRDRGQSRRGRPQSTRDHERASTPPHGLRPTGIATGSNRQVANRPKGNCHYCNNPGHFMKECLKKKRDEASQRPQDPKAMAQ